MKILQVPQREVAARIRFGNGRMLDGAFYVPEVGPDGGPGRLIDRLNSDAESFLPLVCEARRLVIAKAELDLIELVSGLEDPVAEEEAAEECLQAVRITLRQGEAILGRIRYSGRPEQRRLLDYLNRAPAFIRVIRDGGTTYVARKSIVTVQEEHVQPT